MGGGSYLFPEVQSSYHIAPSNWASRDIDLEFLQTIGSGWKAFTPINFVLKTISEKTLYAFLFKSTFLSVISYFSKTWRKNSYDTEGYANIHTDKIVLSGM